MEASLSIGDEEEWPDPPASPGNTIVDDTYEKISFRSR